MTDNEPAYLSYALRWLYSGILTVVHRVWSLYCVMLYLDCVVLYPDCILTVSCCILTVSLCTLTGGQESDRCDARTQLEVQGYSAWLQGTVLFELAEWTQHWEAPLMFFDKAL